MSAPTIIYDKFCESVEKFPEKTALIVGDKAISYMDLLQQVKDLESSLNKRCLKKSSLAVVSENGFLFPVAALLASKINATIIPIAVGLKLNQLQNIFRIAKPSLVIVTSKMCSMSECIQELPERDFAIIELSSAIDLSVKRLHESNNLLELEQDNNEPAYVMSFTSGSTGAPKPVRISQATKLKRVFHGTADLFGLTCQDITLISTPQYHSLGFRQTLVPILTGGTGVILPQFSATAWLEAVKKYKVTFSIGVSSQISQIVASLDNASASELTSLVTLVSSSAPFSLAQRKLCRKILRCRIFECYGASEIGIATILEIGDQNLNKQSVGLAPEYAEVGIFEQRTKALQSEVGEVGEIGVKSELIFSGYHKLPEATKQAFSLNYFLTGDLGYLSSSGELFLVGRTSETIQNAGITVYPSDIEHCCRSISDVTDACAVGVQDQCGHEKIGLLIVANDDVSNDAILRHLIRELAPWQIPSKILRAEKIPLTAIGKVDRSAVCKKFRN